MADRDSWPDEDGLAVGEGDWIEVWCSWTKQPKFEGRPVRVDSVQGAGDNAVFRLQDPDSDFPAYMPARSSGYRRSQPPPSISQIIAKTDIDDDSKQGAG